MNSVSVFFSIRLCLIVLLFGFLSSAQAIEIQVGTSSIIITETAITANSRARLFWVSTSRNNSEAALQNHQPNAAAEACNCEVDHSHDAQQTDSLESLFDNVASALNTIPDIAVSLSLTIPTAPGIYPNEISAGQHSYTFYLNYQPPLTPPALVLEPALYNAAQALQDNTLTLYPVFQNPQFLQVLTLAVQSATGGYSGVTSPPAH